MNLFNLGILAGLASAVGNTQYLNWTLGWKTVNPDGLKDRIVVAINDEWPLPVVRVKRGDRMIINVTNDLGEPARNSSIHFHGLFQNGTNDMDGATFLTQCPSGPSTSFVYNFTVDQPGTYWYHAHVTDLYPDGYRQLFLVDDDDAWFQDQVDEEIAFSLSDWYHELTASITQEKFMILYNPTGAEPVPQSLLFNDTVNPRWEVKPNKTYRLRIANTGTFAGYYFYIPGHKFTIVEVDGVYTEPKETELIYISAAQRYSILFHTSSSPEEVYQLVQIADISMFDIVPSDLQMNETAYLYTGNPSNERFVPANHTSIYNTAPLITSGKDNTGAPIENLDESSFTSEHLRALDDMELVPYEHEDLYSPVTKNITLHLEMSNLYDGKPYAFFNDITWTAPKVPSLFSALSAPNDDYANNETIYGSNTHSYVLEHHDIAQIILNNDDTGKHPFHLHGHNFQVVKRGAPAGDDYTPYDPAKDDGNYPSNPIRRDTVVVNPNSYFLLRFRADNPGVWFFHCHVEWHLTQGLALEFIEAPAQLRQNYKVHPLSSTHQEACKSVDMAMKGNAAGNVESFFDLTGENKQVKFLPSNFTARGIVAMVFSVISAFVGMGFLCWYGATDVVKAENNDAVREIRDLEPEENEESTESQNLVRGDYGAA